MNEFFPDRLMALGLAVLLLGMKHGFDADHLATIDGMARFNAQANPRLARACGAWFSLGHGAVLTAAALGASALAGYWSAPGWLELAGAWVSIAFLLLLGLMNMQALLRSAPGQARLAVSLKARLLGRWSTAAASPGLVALVGALFALSFDTISQASLLAVGAIPFGGWPCALLLGLTFTCGMLLADGINGYWVARLLRRADQAALAASRAMGWVIVCVSLLVALFGALKLAMPGVAAWGEGKELALGLGVVAAIAIGFALAMGMSRAPARCET